MAIILSHLFDGEEICCVLGRQRSNKSVARRPRVRIDADEILIWDMARMWHQVKTSTARRQLS